MREAIILKETKFCKLMKINSVSPDIFSLLNEHTSYIYVARCHHRELPSGESDGCKRRYHEHHGEDSKSNGRQEPQL